MNDSDIKEAQSKVDAFRENPSQGVYSVSDLWEAKRIIDSAVNHATGEIIHPVGRMCAFVPSSLPITLGMLTMTSTPSILFWQWVNQSYNAVFNYSHRSHSGSDKTELLKAYGLATGTSCGLALGLNAIASNIKPPWLISTFAVMAAGSANVAFTRSREMTEGISVIDESGSKIGTSKIAGQYAVGYTILSRSIFLPIPIMVVPGYMSAWIGNRLLRGTGGGASKLVLNIACILFSQAVALPLCIAAFPQKLALKPSQLEQPEFGTNDETVYINKGV